MIDWDRLISLLMTYGVPGIITVYIATKQYQQHNVQQSHVVAVDTQADMLAQYKLRVEERDAAYKARDAAVARADRAEYIVEALREVLSSATIEMAIAAYGRRRSKE